MSGSRSDRKHETTSLEILGVSRMGVSIDTNPDENITRRQLWTKTHSDIFPSDISSAILAWNSSEGPSQSSSE